MQKEQKYVLFGDAAEQIDVYNTVNQNMQILKIGTKNTKKETLSFAICFGNGKILTCIKTQPEPFVPEIMSARYFALVQTHNGETKNLYGTVANLLFNQYVHGAQPVLNLKDLLTPGKTK